MIEELGYDSTVIFIVTEIEDDKKLEMAAEKDADVMETIITVR